MMKVVAPKSLSMLEKITSTIGELPASPAIVSAVMGLTADLNSKVEDLGKVLAADPSLTAKVLKLSNSSFYGRSRAVSSLKEAILILGFYTLRSIVMATSTHSLYFRKDNIQFSQKLWDHSLGCALAARLAGRLLDHPKVEEIFIGGLLHDIGKIILGQKLPDVYDRLVREIEEKHLEFHDAELAKLGFTHVDVGAVVLDRWNFPAELITGIRNHHQKFEPNNGGPAPIGAVISLANHLSKRLAIGFADQRLSDEITAGCAERLGISAEDTSQLATELQARFVEEKQLFGEY